MDRGSRPGRAAALRLALLIPVPWLLPACGSGAPVPVPAVEAAPPGVADLEGPEQLRREFLGTGSRPRLVLFLSPT